MGLILLLANSFFHLFLTSVNSTTELTRDIWSFGSHSGQFLNCKPTRDVPSRPDPPWAAVQTRRRTHINLKGICIGVKNFASLNFTAVFSMKNKNFSKVACNFPREKVNFSLIHPTHITIHSSWRKLLIS